MKALKTIVGAAFASLLLLQLTSALAQPRFKKITAIGALNHPDVKEVSGMVQSRIAPNAFWIHNDSFNKPRLYCIDDKAEMIMPPWLPRLGYVAHAPKDEEKLFPGLDITRAALNDWEDITWMDDKLYIAETGNNGNARRDLGLWELYEPNPYAVENAGVFRFIPIAYPDQDSFPPKGAWNFDCEAIFSWHHKIYFVTKHRPHDQVFTPANSTTLYRLDSMHTDKLNILTKVDHMENTGGWITAADSDQDGKLVAILVEAPKQCVWLFDVPAKGDRFFSNASRVRRLEIERVGQLESLAFYRKDGKDSLMTSSEDGHIFKLELADFEEVKAASPKSSRQ